MLLRTLIDAEKLHSRILLFCSSERDAVCPRDQSHYYKDKWDPQPERTAIQPQTEVGDVGRWAVTKAGKEGLPFETEGQLVFED